MAAASASFFNSSKLIACASTRIRATRLLGPPLWNSYLIKKRFKICEKVVIAAAPAATAPAEEIKECVLPTWVEFDLGRAPLYWKTMNGFPPTAEVSTRPSCEAVSQEQCSGKSGKADPPIYTIQPCIPKHALSRIISFTNGTEWGGPYRMQFQVPKAWRNRPIEFSTEGLAEELSKEGACEQAIYPDTNVVVTSRSMIGNLSVEGGDCCSLDLVLGCTDPSSTIYNPLVNVDGGSCLLSDSED